MRSPPVAGRSGSGLLERLVVNFPSILGAHSLSSHSPAADWMADRMLGILWILLSDELEDTLSRRNMTDWVEVELSGGAVDAENG